MKNPTRPGLVKGEDECTYLLNQLRNELDPSRQSTERDKEHDGGADAVEQRRRGGTVVARWRNEARPVAATTVASKFEQRRRRPASKAVASTAVAGRSMCGSEGGARVGEEGGGWSLE